MLFNFVNFLSYPNPCVLFSFTYYRRPRGGANPCVLFPFIYYRRPRRGAKPCEWDGYQCVQPTRHITNSSRGMPERLGVFVSGIGFFIQPWSVNITRCKILISQRCNCLLWDVSVKIHSLCMEDILHTGICDFQMMLFVEVTLCDYTLRLFVTCSLIPPPSSYSIETSGAQIFHGNYYLKIIICLVK